MMDDGRLEVKITWHPPEDSMESSAGLAVSFSKEGLESTVPGVLLDRIKFMLTQLAQKCPELAPGLKNQFGIKDNDQ